MASKFVFARKDRKIIHIGELPIELKGLKCEATCPMCNEPLIARMGDIRSHYFAHASNTQCKFNNESALHLLAKEIIYKYKFITLPDISLKYIIKQNYHGETEEYVDYFTSEPIIIDEIKDSRYFGKDSYDFIPYKYNQDCARGSLSELKYYSLKEAASFSFDMIQLEEGYLGKIIDLIGIVNNTKLGIEIKVTHAVDRDKKQFLRNNNLPTIEIDLSEYLDMNMDDFNIEDFKNMLIYSVNHKSWIVIEDELNQVNKVDKILKDRYHGLNISALIKAKNKKVQQNIAYKKYDELVDYYTDKIKLYKRKNYKDIKYKYFMPKDKEFYMQKRLLNKMSNSERFDKSYIGKFIAGDILYFKCDFKTWQAIIIYKFIFSNKIGDVFTLNEVVDFFLIEDSTKEYFDRKFYKIAENRDKVRRFKQVIFDYLDYLIELNIIRGQGCKYYNINYNIQYFIKI